MAKDGTVTVKITGDSKGLKDALDDSDGRLNKFGGKMGGVAQNVGKAFLGMGTAAAGFGVLSVKAFAEAEQVSAQTAAVLKSTGGIAKVTAQDVDALSGSLSRMSGVDDEAIASGQNLLLTFTKVRNEVGAGNDIFDQATKAALDMSVAMGTDMKSASMLMGKALNDPIKGMTALTRSGVSFTQAQKDQVKAMVAAGDTMGAQKLILKEMETQFGGSAKAAGDTFAGQLNKLKVVIGNFMEDAGAKLVPILMTIGKWLGDKIPKAIAFLRPTFDLVVTGVQAFVAALKEGDVTSDGFVGVMETIGDALHRFAGFVKETVLPAIQAFIGFVKDNAAAVIAGLAAIVAGIVVPAFVAWAAASAAAAVATIAAAAPAIALAAVLGALAAGVVHAYQNFEGFRDVVDKVAGFLKNTVLPGIGAFVGYITDQFGNLVRWVQQFWPQISETISHVFNVVAGIVRTTIDVISALWRAWGDDLLRVVKTVWNFIRETIENAIQVIKGIIQTVVALINGDWGKAWDGIKNIVGAVWDQIGNIISTAIGAIKSLIGGLGSTIAEMARGLWDPIKDGFKSVINWIIRGWNGLEFKMPGVDTPLGKIGGFTVGVPDIPLLAAGGLVTRPTLAMLGEAGPEAVIPLSRMGNTATNVTMNLNVTAIDPAAAQEAVIAAIKEYERRNGTNWRVA